MRTGPRNLITDVAGLRVGNATDTRLRSGVTVLTGDAPFVAGVHVMGGAPGTRETDLLAPDKLVEGVDALVLAGGSVFGLDAASGVTDALAALGRGFRVGAAVAPIVPAAILFDLGNGGDKAWSRNPYRDLGEEALAVASADFALGSFGAGAGARAGRLKGGLGSASLVLPGGVTVGALVAVNALGQTTVGSGRHFWAAPFEIGDEFGGLGPATGATDIAATFDTKRGPAEGASTTIAIVATDARLTKAQATRVAAAAHDGLARAIVPAHTPFDGDLVFAAATGAHAAGDAASDTLRIGHAAALCLSRAVARAVHAARAWPGEDAPAWSSLPRQA
jgi:D-aminopeptidase